MALRVFISCVSEEFRSYREQLRRALTTSDREIKIQEDFTDGGGSLLEKLDQYISRCHAVIHLVGESVGSKARPAEIRRILDNHLDFTQTQDELASWLDPKKCPFSYTQWECFLALYHRVPCYVYVAAEGSVREAKWSRNDQDADEQRAHIERLRSLGQYRREELFSDARDIAIRFLNSYQSEGGQTPRRPAHKFAWPAIPALTPFPIANRENALISFRELLSSASAERILLFQGPSDQGKSVLLNHFFRATREMSGLKAAYAEFKNGLPLRDVLLEAKRDLVGLRFPRFERELERDLPEMLRAAFLQDIEETTLPVVLLLDTYEQATDEAKAWVEHRLLPFCRSFLGICVVIAGQSVPQITGTHRLSGLAKTIVLSSIDDPRAWCDYSRRVVGLNSLPDEHIATLVTAARGSPRAVSAMLDNLKSKESIA